MRKKPDRVIGVYGHEARWRVHYVRGGVRTIETCDSKAEADKFAEKMAKRITEAERLTVSDALPLYLAHLKGTCTAVSTETAHRKVLEILPDDLVLSTLTSKAAVKLYETARERYAASTHRAALTRVRAFCGWLVAENKLRENPFAAIKKVGRERKGAEAHPQLTDDEGGRWLQEALRHDEPAAVACVCCLLLGLRIGDLLGSTPIEGVKVREGCKVRDLDRNGTVLRGIGKGNKPYVIKVPLVLQPKLAALVAGRFPLQPLFDICSLTAVHRCRAICRAAGVPEVTPHGLRGTGSSTLAARGELPDVLAEHFRHSAQMNRQHYTTADAAQEGEITRRLAVLQGGK